ncbi:hypothetical protein HQ447_11595 [bacterium]|nr:hypothetical protein [bacterium]
MNDDENYARSVVATPERIAASVLVAAWIGAAFFFSGLPDALRVAVFYLVPLTFIWIPTLMARLDIGSYQNPGPRVATPANALRLVGWLAIVGVPLTWAAFWWSTR